MQLHRRLALLAGLAVVSLIAFTGCAQKPAAVVNGTRIDRDRFYEILEKSGGAGLMVQLVSEELILQEAAKEKVSPTPVEVDRRLGEVKKANAEALQGLTDAEARRQVLIMLATRNLALKGVTVPDSEVKATFEKHKKEFDQPEAVVLKRAVFKSKKEAETARETLMKANVEFGVVLGQSIDLDAIRERGGALPALIRKSPGGSIVFMMSNPQTNEPVEQPASLLLGAGVAEKAFGMPEKSIMDVLPCQRPQGFQVIQIQEHRQPKGGDYAEWQERIREQLLLEKRFSKEPIPQGVDAMTYYRAKLVGDLKKKAQIQVNIERLKDLPQRADAWPNVGGGGGR